MAKRKKRRLPSGVAEMVAPERLECLKWIAVVAMAADHAGRVFFEPDGMAFALAYATGRLAFPLFAWIAAVRLVARPDCWSGYLNWLLPFAALSQIPHAVSLQAGVSTDVAAAYPVAVMAGVPEGWNILFTLAAGVAMATATRAALSGDGSLRALAGPAAVGAVAAGVAMNSEYGLAGAMLVPLFAEAVKGSKALAVSVLAVAVWYVNAGDGAMGLLALPAAGVAPWLVAFARPEKVWAPPRLPRWAFYAFYPAHLVALATFGGQPAPDPASGIPIAE